jgi:hypothetical protein
MLLYQNRIFDSMKVTPEESEGISLRDREKKREQDSFLLCYSRHHHDIKQHICMRRASDVARRASSNYNKRQIPEKMETCLIFFEGMNLSKGTRDAQFMSEERGLP